MLRLAHRILSQVPHFEDVSFQNDFNSVCESLANGCHVVIADNVDEYARHEVRPVIGDHLGLTPADMPVCLPPFSELFVEWNLASDTESLQYGIHFNTHVADELPKECHRLWADDQDSESVFHVSAAKVFATAKNGNLVMTASREYFFFDKCGKNLFSRNFGKNYTPAVTALMAIGFMHCKNVVRTDATETEGPPAKWLRRMKQPTLRYHVLNINPMKEVLRKEGGSDTNGLKKALHICRGHFATYTPDKPLFGNFVGTVWKPAHVRGSKEFGEVRKDYKVNSP